jgi:hypothetical protein
MSCCERHYNSIDCIINRTFSPNNIDRVAYAVSEDTCWNVNMLDELIQNRDGTFNLSYNMSDRKDIEQLTFLICTN